MKKFYNGLMPKILRFFIQSIAKKSLISNSIFGNISYLRN